MATIGFMQGRLSPIVGGKIQAFPWDHWQAEFALAAQLGFDTMEWTIERPHLYANPLLLPVGREKIHQLCLQYGVTIPSLTGDCFMQAPFWKVEDRKTRLHLLGDMHAVLDASGELGIQLVIIPLVDNGRLENEAQSTHLFDGLKAMEGLLRRANLQIAFESDFPPQKLKLWINRLDPQLFGINYDSGNSAALGYGPEEELAAYGDRILNVHIKDRLLGGTTVPLGTGNVDLPRLCQLLVDMDYSGKYILQTARAADGNHAGVLRQYRDQVAQWLTPSGE